MHSTKLSATQNSELSLFVEEVEKTTPNENVANETATVNVINEQEVLGKSFKMYGTFESPLFLAKDVAIWIDYSISNVSKMLNYVDEDEKTTRTIITSGSNYKTEAWFLTEDGLYEILMKSTKPIAKQFKKEVKKILHDLRVGNTQIVPSYNIPKTLSEALRLAADQAEQIEAQQKLLEAQQPKVELHDKALNAEGTFSIAQVAKMLNLPYGSQTLFKNLRCLGILLSDNSPAQSQSHLGRFIVVNKTVVIGDKTENKPVTRVTYKGVEYIAKKLGVIYTPKKELSEKEIAEYRAKLADKSYMTKAIESVASEMADNEMVCREVR